MKERVSVPISIVQRSSDGRGKGADGLHVRTSACSGSYGFRTGPKPAHRVETERPHRIATPIYDRSRYRAHRHQGQERHQATQTSTEHKRLHSRSPRGPSSRRTQVKHHSRERRKTTLTTLLSSSSYYRYQTTTKKRGKTGAGSGAESSTVYGHTPVRLDETTWTLM